MLVGKAKGSVDQQTINNGDYNGAWQILNKKFDNERVIVDYTHQWSLEFKENDKGVCN